MFDYLYYKLYQASLKSSLKDMPQILAPIYMGALIGLNIIIINGFLVKIAMLPFLFKNPKLAGWLNAMLIALAMLYYRKEKRKSVIDKYSQESEKKRIRGNIAVTIYVSLSLILIFAVAFFRPGKL